VTAPSPEHAFLWQRPPPPPSPGAFVPRGEAWWNGFVSRLPRLSPAARQELTRTSREIVSLLPDPASWGDRPSPFKGVVVGSVQSGKTTSMMGVAATAFDYGFRIAVILAGLKDDLRQQTARRFNTTLMGQSDGVPGTTATTMGRPPSPGPLGGFALPYHLDTTRFALLQLRLLQALNQGNPSLLIVKKNANNLAVLRDTLRVVVARFGPARLPILILDDECDEASVSMGGPAIQAIPEQIGNVLAMSASGTNIAYVGYTATAAANLLQDPAAPLFPSHFAYLLRHPARSDGVLEFKEPDPDNWYTGSSCFYEEFGEEPGEEDNFLVRTAVSPVDLGLPPEANPSLRDAIIAFFVGGAYRLQLHPDADFRDPDRLPSPHSMLIHTSPQIAEHVEWARGLQRLCGGEVAGLSKDWKFNQATLAKWLNSDPAPWREWYEKFERSRDTVYARWMRGGVQSPASWEQVLAKLPDVFENSRVRLVNSDEELGSSLDFVGGIDTQGKRLPPRDVYTIVLGGSRLSRGITIEGLCISYFARWAPVPREDTILQMSRWFGYRGPHLEFCRLFVSSPAFEYLREMHEHDRELRLALAGLMDRHLAPSDAMPLLRSNRHSLPTNKLGAGTKVDLDFAGHGQVFRGVECGAQELRNQGAALKFVVELRSRNAEEVRRGGTGRLRGWLARDWSLGDVARWLDTFEYTGHNPRPDSRPISDFYRPRDLNRPESVKFDPWSDPYEYAAYLRAWSADETLSKPKFNVGVAVGELDQHTDPFDFPLANRTILIDDILSGGWVGPGASWDGDARFDGVDAGLLKRGTSNRLATAPGLLLLYVVHRDSTGRGGHGKVRGAHTPTFGVSLPAGGPQLRWIVPK
jgi:hypothetical protein